MGTERRSAAGRGDAPRVRGGRSALAAGMFAAGLFAAGGILGALLSQALGKGPPAPRVSQAAGPASAPPGAGGDRGPGHALELPRPWSPQEASGSPTSDPTDGSRRVVTEAPAGDGEAIGPLGLVRLRTLVQHPDFAGWARRAPDDAWELAFHALLRSGQPQEALALLRERSPTLAEEGARVDRIAQALGEQGQRAAAADLLWESLLLEEAALVESLARVRIWGAHGISGDARWQRVERLSSHAPERALALIDRVGGLPGQRAARLDTIAAWLLLRSERVPEAVELLLPLLAVHSERAAAQSMLVTHAPRALAERLSAELEADPGDPLGRSRLASALFAAGDVDEALALLEGLLAEGLQDRGLAQLLSEHGEHLPAETLVRISEGLEYDENFEYSLLDLLVNAGQLPVAVARYDRMVDALVAGREAYWMPLPPDELIAADPTRAYGWARRIEEANLSNDEIIGDAGDLYAALGFSHEALRMYERALILDPNDGEWIDKVAEFREKLGLPPR